MPSPNDTYVRTSRTSAWLCGTSRWFLLLLLLALAGPAGCGGGGGGGGQGAGPQRLRQVLPGQGLQVMAVDFVFDEAAIVGPPWWRIELDPGLLSERTGIPGGYLNVVTAAGWAVQNLPVPPQGEQTLAFYCDLGLDASPDLLITEVDLQVMHTSRPVGDIRAQLAEMEDALPFHLAHWQWNAQGVGDKVTVFGGAPDRIASLDSIVPVGSETFAVYQAVTNVQTAKDQCMPMAFANALQFLENQGVLTVPHGHAAGLKGDTTLVGQLDTASGRPATSRTAGEGVWFTPMVDGLFKYLKDNQRNGQLTFRHQGRGYGTAPSQALAAGNHASSSSTSQDDGAAMTFNWILARLRAGCGIVAVMRFDPVGNVDGGGHAVRVTGCGRRNGIPWVRYSHDAKQTHQDAKDTKGLENVLVWLQDTDNDGKLNFGGPTRELWFLFAECP